jgi:hypothetical protein
MLDHCVWSVNFKYLQQIDRVLLFCEIFSHIAVLCNDLASMLVFACDWLLAVLTTLQMVQHVQHETVETQVQIHAE